MRDKKFSLPETIIALMIVVPLDLLELVSGTFFTVILFILNIVVWFVFLIWFSLKGGHYGRTMIRATVWIISNFLELFPVLAGLPWRTAALLFAIRSINSPKEDEDEGDKKEGRIQSKLLRGVEKRVGKAFESS